jgi:hypothetical protein
VAVQESLGQLPALRTATSWVATDVFKFPKPLTMLSGSGDKPYDYALAALLLTVAAVATALWSVLDRRRPNDMDDSFAPYGTKVDTASKTIALTKAPVPGTQNGAPAPAGRLTYQQPAPERLILDGEIDRRKLRMELQNFASTNFRLGQTRFRWVQDLPFNR